jgi:hypothetical protein
MKRKLMIIAICLSAKAFAQGTKEAAYLEALGLTIVDSISAKDIIGDIYSGNGFVGSAFWVDSNMTFKKSHFMCMGGSDLDSGTWIIQDKNTLVLTSKTQTLYYDVVKFDEFYFFILPTERQKFIDDLQMTRAKLKNGKPFKINNQYRSENYLIWYFLKPYYYTKRIKIDTGI